MKKYNYDYSSIKLSKDINKMVDELIEGTGFKKQVFIDNAVRQAVTDNREFFRKLKDKQK